MLDKEKQDMLHMLKVLLGMDVMQETNDTILLFVLDTVITQVLDYCHRKDLPDGLKNTVVRMALDMYREEQFGSASVPAKEQTVKVGDTSTTFSTEQSTCYVDSLLKNYEKQLKNYRKLRVR